jgi:hypothetical protein
MEPIPFTSDPATFRPEELDELHALLQDSQEPVPTLGTKELREIQRQLQGPLPPELLQPSTPVVPSLEDARRLNQALRMWQARQPQPYAQALLNQAERIWDARTQHQLPPSTTQEATQRVVHRWLGIINILLTLNYSS